MKKNSFVVKDLFGHQIPNQVLQWMSDSFQAKILNPHQDMVIEFENTPELEFYVLKKDMGDSAIKRTTNSKPMKIGDYFLTRKLLIIDGQAQKNKRYLFHIELEDRTVCASRLKWGDDEWISSEFPFDDDGDWDAGDVFVLIKRN